MQYTRVIDISNFNIVEKDIMKDMDLILRKAYLEFFSGVVLSTPVDTGRARGNWRCDFNKFSEKSNENYFDRTGTRTVKKIQKKILKQSHSPLTDAYTLDNNIYYVVYLEDGHSKQAPAGMVKINIDRFEESLINAIKAVQR